MSYMRGRLYLQSKGERGGDRKSKGQNVPLKNTAEEDIDYPNYKHVRLWASPDKYKRINLLKTAPAMALGYAFGHFNNEMSSPIRCEIINANFQIDYNYITLNEMQEISTIEKIANSVTIIFDTFDTAEEIEVKYSIDGGATYTSLGTATEAIDGSSITQKTFLFGDDVTFYKMLIRIHLDGDGTSTPTIKDISMQYLPIPDYKYRWSFILDCGDDITTLDNKSKELLKGVDLRHKLRTSFLKRELLELEDVDYAETKMNDASPAKTDVTITVDSTDDFPEQGRIKINDEEILYTGKTRTTFTGCTRGYRGTNAAAHADNDVISNKYKVLITDYNESIPLSNESRIGEFEVAVEMLEA